MSHKNGSLQFTLRDVALAIFLLAAVLALGRGSGLFDHVPQMYEWLRPVHGLCVAGLSLYVAGHVAFWRGRLRIAVLLMLGGVAAFVTAAICWIPLFMSG